MDAAFVIKRRSADQSVTVQDTETGAVVTIRADGRTE